MLKVMCVKNYLRLSMSTLFNFCLYPRVCSINSSAEFRFYCMYFKQQLFPFCSVCQINKNGLNNMQNKLLKFLAALFSITLSVVQCEFSRKVNCEVMRPLLSYNSSVVVCTPVIFESQKCCTLSVSPNICSPCQGGRISAGKSQYIWSHTAYKSFQRCIQGTEAISHFIRKFTFMSVPVYTLDTHGFTQRYLCY